MLGALKARGLIWPAVAALAVVVFLVALGNWQMRRLAWKEGLIAAIAARAHSEPVPLAQAEERASRGEDIEYARVKVDGQLMNEHEIHLYAFDETYGPGYHVITPLRLADGSSVLVNRGFVPEDLREPAKRQAGQQGGTVTIVGLVRAPEESVPSRPLSLGQRQHLLVPLADRDPPLNSWQGILPELLHPVGQESSDLFLVVRADR